MTKFLVVAGIDILAECEDHEGAQEQAKVLAMETGKSTQVMNATELQNKVEFWASNDDTRVRSVVGIEEGIKASADHSGVQLNANAELEKGIRQKYARVYMSGTFDAGKLATAGTALWQSPRHTRVRNGVVSTGFNILGAMRDGKALTSRPGGRKPSQVEWVLLEYARLLLASGKGVTEIIAEVV